MKNNIDDIKVVNEVIFYSTNHKSIHDEYWTVIGKSVSNIMIEFKKFGFDENWKIDKNEVVGRIPKADNN